MVKIFDQGFSFFRIFCCSFLSGTTFWEAYYREFSLDEGAC